jgi:hypothetical protein
MSICRLLPRAPEPLLPVRLLADDLGDVVGRRRLADVLGGDDRDAGRLLEFLLRRSQDLDILQLQCFFLGVGDQHRQRQQRGGGETAE